MYQVTIYRPRKRGTGLYKLKTIPPEELVVQPWPSFGNKSYGKLGIGNGRRKKPKEMNNGE